MTQQSPTQEQLRELKGRQIPLRELLALFGTRFRNDHIIFVISQALKDVGLTTLPYFASCGSRSDVQVVALDTTPAGDDEAPESQADQDLPSGSLPQHSFTVGDLPSASGGVDSVTSDAKLSEAVYMMYTKNFSQVPVLEDRHTLTGVATWRSVAIMYANGSGHTLSGAIEPDPPVVQSHQDFFSMLPMISEHGYVLVRDNGGRVSGIVTSADVTDRFEATAWPFFVVGEIEFRLRKCLGAKITSDAIRAVQRFEKTGLINDLMFNDYVKLLNREQKKPHLCDRANQNWAALGWTWLDRGQFVRQLDRVREIRNKIAHFDPEPLPPQLTDELRQFLTLLRRLG
ncbi:CBS domain-containing protein [Streptomyces tubbatahanensis]|uniref:CBS domain-containing protein n=1 Tax=Streptomyces tubbatahanensis TaxID=2923272 RepID=A0ABY3XUM9_9ACTN|nr:CBS domain-containing protein [Streptomyces tubbatahanensis]UNS98182.1 CBS domain-containing protein [Streptomyces tubbatahanensis]